MLQAKVIGYLGADAETKSENGREFTTCRVAHTDRWTDPSGQTKETTQWVDVIWNGRPNVAEYLKKGVQVYIEGYAKLRCYSSAAAHGFVAGIQISPTSLELLGGSTDKIPSRLYTAEGQQVDVAKYYHCELAGGVLTNGRGREYVVDDHGWILTREDYDAYIAQQQQQAGSDDAQLNQQTAKKNGRKKG